MRDDAYFDTLIDRRFDDGGPLLFAVKIDDAPGQGQTVCDPALIRCRFMKGLAPAAAARSTRNPQVIRYGRPMLSSHGYPAFTRLAQAKISSPP